MKIGSGFILGIALMFASLVSKGQETSGEESAGAESSVSELIHYLEYTLNTIGNPKTEVREKERIINESFAKLFESKSVFIEDDLDPNREVISNKYVQGYLKDIDFFFTSINFSFQILNITLKEKADGSSYFLVEMIREMRGIDAQNRNVHNKKERYVEVNYNDKTGELKIASIYTLGINERQILNDWWDGLSFGWMEVLQSVTGEGKPDFSDLKKISELEVLDISGNKILADLRPLELLKNLKELNISDTEIKDVSSLRYLSGLKVLKMRNVRVNNLSALRYANQLSILDAGNTSVSNSNFLKNLVNLREIYLDGTLISELKGLSQSSNVSKIDISNTMVNSIIPLKNNMEIEELNVESTNVSDISLLNNFSKLWYLNVSYSQVTDVKALSSLPNLEEIVMVGTAISDLSSLAELPKLEKINCNQSLIKKEHVDDFLKQNPDVLIIHDTETLRNWWNDLDYFWLATLSDHLGITGQPEDSDLARLARLDSLKISETEITLPDPLLMLPSLKELFAENINFSDWQALSSLDKLQSLNLKGTNISNLKPLSNLKNLEILNIEQTKIESLMPLNDLPNLRIIFADQSKVTGSSVIEFRKRNTNVSVIYRTSELNNWWGTLDDAWKDFFSTEYDLYEKPDTESLHELTSISKITITNKPNIHLLNPLNIFTSIKTLELTELELSQISYLSNFKTLEELTINRINLQDLSFVRSLGNLRKLNIRDTPVSTLQPLKNNFSLSELTCSGTLIGTLRPLKRFGNLRRLDLSNTDVGNLHPVMDLNLDYLSCFNTKIPYYQVEKFKKFHPSAEVVYY